MIDEKQYLVDVGMQDLPFPMRVISKTDSGGQHTIANISINARIMQEFEARWIDKFIQIVHDHRERIGTVSLRGNILDYVAELNATLVRIDFEYPFFIEKTTPVSKEKCLVKYQCIYSAKAISTEKEPTIHFRMKIPCITTYPGSLPEEPGGLFGQLSIVDIDVQSKKDVYPEDLVSIVDRHSLSPVYSFLTQKDQHAIIQKVHTVQISSVSMLEKIKQDLSRNRAIEMYSVLCSNYGMLHSYSTIIGTEKSRWVPFSMVSSDEDKI